MKQNDFFKRKLLLLLLLFPLGDFVTDLGGRFKYPWEVNQFGFNGTIINAGVSFSF